MHWLFFTVNILTKSWRSTNIKLKALNVPRNTLSFSSTRRKKYAVYRIKILYRELFFNLNLKVFNFRMWIDMFYTCYSSSFDIFCEINLSLFHSKYSCILFFVSTEFFLVYNFCPKIKNYFNKVSDKLFFFAYYK